MIHVITLFFIQKQMKPFSYYYSNVEKHMSYKAAYHIYEKYYPRNQYILPNKIDDYLNVDCENCVNCYGCIRCVDCVDCVDCEELIRCKNCITSNECVDCENCVDCEKCRYLADGDNYKFHNIIRFK
jgi:hypothetical protein